MTWRPRVAAAAATTAVGLMAARSDPLGVLRVFDPVLGDAAAETGHRVAVRAAALPSAVRWALGLHKAERRPVLETQVWGIVFPNVVGLAAGCDKHAEAMQGMLDLGFGFVEIGSVTPEPQPGNPKPRVWKIKEEGVVINRYGFNSDGHAVVEERLYEYRQGSGRDTIVGVNLGVNKDKMASGSLQLAGIDYAKGVLRLGSYASYIVINVSSPNTAGLRGLQDKKILRDVLENVIKSRDAVTQGTGSPLPLLVKIAPDLSAEEQDDIAKAVIETGVDGLIISNTTVSWPPSIQAKAKGMGGGLSGAPLREPSLAVLRSMYQKTRGKIPLIGVGGITTGADAYAKIRAGASLVQLYSSMSLHGPHIPSQVSSELEELLTRDGYTSVSQAVGADAQ